MMAAFTNEEASLLIIDPQNDFHPGGSLAVTGANEDSQRIADMIMKNWEKIGNIYITLDSHHKEHIAHGVFWSDKADGTGSEPQPFQLISHDDVINNRWHPKDPSLKKYCEDYTKALEEKGRFKLCIWPQHCIIGSEGHKVVDSLQKALDFWSEKHNGKKVQYVNKGMNNFTEMYSAIAAEVPIEADPQTKVNFEFLTELKKSKKLLICGEALSHCVNYTTRDITDHWAPNDMSNLVLLTDASSPVTGFDADANKFIEDMKALNLTMSTTTEFFAST